MHKIIFRRVPNAGQMAAQLTAKILSRYPLEFKLEQPIPMAIVELPTLN
jgi:hypothetical protein